MHGIIRVEIRDADGQLTHQSEQPMRSPLKAFLQILLMRMGAADVAAVKDTGGSDRTIDQSDTTTMMDATGGANDDTTGIVVGTGTTVVAIDDNALGTQIADGNGATQLDHGAQNNPADVANDSDSSDFQLARIFTNNSGSAIVIGEAGIYAKNSYTGAGTGVFCIARDILDSTKSVANGGTAIVVYIFRIKE